MRSEIQRRGIVAWCASGVVFILFTGLAPATAIGDSSGSGITKGGADEVFGIARGSKEGGAAKDEKVEELLQSGVRFKPASSSQPAIEMERENREGSQNESSAIQAEDSKVKED